MRNVSVKPMPGPIFFGKGSRVTSERSEGNLLKSVAVFLPFEKGGHSWSSPPSFFEPGLDDQNELPGVLDTQRPKYKGVHQAEDRGVGADA